MHKYMYALHYITSHYITLHHITSHYITLHYIKLHYIALHNISLHYIRSGYRLSYLHIYLSTYLHSYILHTYLHGKRLTESRLFFQPWLVHFACVLWRICVWVRFFDSMKSFGKPLVFFFLTCVDFH